MDNEERGVYCHNPPVLLFPVYSRSWRVVRLYLYNGYVSQIWGNIPEYPDVPVHVRHVVHS